MGIPLGELQTEFKAGASWARGRYHPSHRRAPFKAGAGC